MIVDIENKGEELKISTFTEEGGIKFINVPIPPEEDLYGKFVRTVIGTGIKLGKIGKDPRSKSTKIRSTTNIEFYNCSKRQIQN